MDPLTLVIAAAPPRDHPDRPGHLDVRDGWRHPRAPRALCRGLEDSRGRRVRQGGVAELIAKSAALAQLNRVVEKRDFGANLLRDLGAADLKLKPSEYLAIWGGLTVGVPVVMYFVGFVVPPSRTRSC
jgi:hypothetical protein